EGSPVAIAVLANDRDVDGDPLTVAGVGAPSHGTAVLNADQTITYTPGANYNGADTFTYLVSDGHGGTATGTVSVTVTAVNDAPVAAADSYSTTEDTPVTVDAPGVLANDTDADGNALRAVIVEQPQFGTVTLNVDGSFTYTPAANANGTDRFTYKANDGTIDSNVATVTIAVQAVNDTPVAIADNYAAKIGRASCRERG